MGQTEQRILYFPEATRIESILTSLLNQIGARPEGVVLILNDYHWIMDAICFPFVKSGPGAAWENDI